MATLSSAGIALPPFAVPADTPALKVDMQAGGAAGSGQVRFLRFHPYGVGIDSNSSLANYNPPVSGGSNASALSRTVANPFPGVWEIAVEARRTSDVLTAPFSITASILGASVDPNPDTIASATGNAGGFPGATLPAPP